MYVALKLGGHDGYVKPWIGETYDFAFTTMFVLIGATLLATAGLVIARRRNGEPSRGSGEPGAV